MADVMLKIDADAANAIQNVVKLGQSFNGVGTAAQTAGRKSKDAGRELAGMATGVGAAAAGALVGFNSLIGGVMAGLRLAKSEFADLDRLRQQQARGTMTLLESRAAAMKNKPPDMSVAEFDRYAADAARTAKAPLKASYDMWGSVLSAGGTLPNAVKGQTLSEALTFTTLDKTIQGPEFAGRVMDIMKASKVEDPAKVIGWVTQGQRAARLVNIDKAAEMFAPVIQALTLRGMTAERAMEWAAAGSQVTQDVQGEQTGTAITRLVQNLDRPILPTGRKGKKDFIPGNTPEDKIDNLRAWWTTADRDQRADLMQSLGGEKAGRMLVEQMISGDQFRMELATAEVAIPAPTAASEDAYRQTLADIVSGPGGKAYQFGVESESITTNMQSAYPELAAAGLTDTAITKVMESLPGLGYGNRKALGMNNWLAQRVAGMSAQESGLRTLDVLEERYGEFEGVTPSLAGPVSLSYDPARSRGKRNPNYDPTAMEHINALRAAIEEQTGALWESNRSTRQFIDILGLDIEATRDNTAATAGASAPSRNALTE